MENENEKKTGKAQIVPFTQVRAKSSIEIFAQIAPTAQCVMKIIFL